MHHLTFHFLAGRCVLCHTLTRRAMDLCTGCEADLPWNLHACLYCSLPIKQGRELCDTCQLLAPGFSAVLCCFVYRFPIDVMIHRFKDHRHLASGKVLTTLLVNYFASTLQQLADADTMIVPVPLHPSRQRQRGFNQSQLIAEGIANVTGLNIDAGLIRRTRKTPDQKALTMEERRENLIGVFVATRPLHGKRILLVDDVVTTTATITAITDCLLAEGAADVVVIALGRTPVTRD